MVDSMANIVDGVESYDNMTEFFIENDSDKKYVLSINMGWTIDNNVQFVLQIYMSCL